MVPRVAIDVTESRVDLCKWDGASLTVCQASADEGWNGWAERLRLAGPFEVNFRFDHGMPEAGGDASAAVEREASAGGATRTSVVSADGPVDPGVTAARQAADRLKWGPFIAVQAGKGLTRVSLVDRRGGGHQSRRERWDAEEGDWFDRAAEILRCDPAIRMTGEAGSSPLRWVCYGEAGPGVAAKLAEACGAQDVMIPIHAATLTAVGLLICDEVIEVRKRLDVPLTETAALKSGFGGLMDAVSLEVIRRGYDIDDAECVRYIEVSSGSAGEPRLEFEFLGLSEIGEIPVKYWDAIGDQPAADNDSDSLRVMSIRAATVIATPKPLLPLPAMPSGAGGAQHGPLRERAKLPVGTVVRGPASISEPYTQTVVPPGWTARVESAGDLVLQCARS